VRQSTNEPSGRRDTCRNDGSKERVYLNDSNHPALLSARLRCRALAFCRVGFQVRNQVSQSTAVFDEVLGQGVFVGSFGLGVMKNDDHMRFDRKPAFVPTSNRILQDFPHLALTFTWPIVISIVFRGVPGGVLDVDMKRVILHMLPEFIGFLPGPGLGLRPVGIEDRIGRVEHSF